eukprot:356141_1
MGTVLDICNDDDDDSAASSLYERHDDSDSFPFANIELSSTRKYDCVLVFNEGSKRKQWKYSQYDTIQYDYLTLLDAEDIEDRKNRFPHHGADWAMNGETDITVYDFNRNERKLVIKALKKLKIKCKSIHSLNQKRKSKDDEDVESVDVDAEEDESPQYRYYYVGINENRARQWAHRIGYPLEIEPDAAVRFLSLHDENLAKATIDHDNATHCAVKHDLWRHVHVEYDMHVAPHIYKEYYGIYGSNNYDPSLFTIRDRISLINDAVTQDIEVGGAGIYFCNLDNHCIIDFFPLHTLEHVQIILRKLFTLHHLFECTKMFNLPLNEFKSYFGSYYAIYFAFLQFMTWYFVPLVVIATLFGILQSIYDIVLVPYIWMLAVFVMVWAMLFPIAWKQKEIRYSKKWGTLRFSEGSHSQERTRPEFIGRYRTSIIDGTEEEFFDPTIRTARRFVSCSIVLTFFIALIGSITAIIVLRIYVTQTTSQYGNYMIAAANSIVIMFFNNVYGLIAEKLNSWENYKTETEYENNLIIKIFIFRFINSYASLYYIAFFRVYEYESSPLYCTVEECMSDLRIQLAFIFLSQMIVNNTLELFPLFMKRCLSGGRGLNTFFTESESDFVYMQYASATYGRTFDDYCELLIAFGYSTLFVVSFPYAPLCAFIGYIVEARIDGYKLCKLSRRPFPRQCRSIGSWQIACEVMAWSVLLTNTIIICFTTQMLDFVPHMLNGDVYLEEVITALIIIICLTILVSFLNGFIGGAPHDISNHIRRQNHIEQGIHDIGANIDKYLDSIVSSNENDSYGWKKWDVDKVAIFLHKVLYKNKIEFNKLKYALKRAAFDGAAFAKCVEIYELDHLHLNDDLQSQDSYFLKKFILNAKKQLIEHQRLAEHQNLLVDSVSLMGDEREESEEQLADHEQSETQSEQEEEEETESTSAEHIKDDVSLSYQQEAMQDSVGSHTQKHSNYFHFTNQNLYGMSLFFENELKQQSKRKLWRRIEKDMVDVIQKHELDSFLYLTICVYVKGAYPNAKVPKYTDKTLRQSMLNPFKNWLLDFKISPPGLTFQQFNTYFVLWIREFYHLKKREFDDEEALNISIGIMKHELNDVDKKKKKKRKYHRHKPRRDRHQFLIPIAESNSDRERQNDDNESYSEYELLSESSLDCSIRSTQWNAECTKWFNRMHQISDFIDTTLESTRCRIWYKFDKHRKDELETNKYLTKLIYSFIVLLIKSRKHSQQSPKYKELHVLTKYFAKDIIKMLPIRQKAYMTKFHFVHNIHIYFKKCVKKRSKLIAKSN